MANALYDKGRQKFLEGAIAWLTDNIKCALVDTADYSVNLGSHEFLSDIPGVAIVATSGNLTGKTSTAGVADADNALFTAVVGDQCEALVIYKDTGVSATSPLIAYIDTALGLPYTPSGGNLTINWSNLTNRIFKL